MSTDTRGAAVVTTDTREIVERLRKLMGIKLALCEGIEDNGTRVEIAWVNEAADTIERLTSQLAEATADNKRLREGLEIMANPEHWGEALDLSSSVGVKAWDFASALLNGSTK